MSAAAIFQALQVMMARIWHRFGWPGLVGLACGAVALGLAWQSHEVALSLAASAETVASAVPTSASMPGQGMPQPLPQAATPPSLPQRSDLPALLSQIEQQAREQGLAWPQAEYRLAALTPERLGELEVAFTLRGGYLPVRAFLNGLLDAQQAMALRELSLRRAHSDVAEIEARIVLVVFLRDGWPHARVWSAPVPAEAGDSP